MNTQEIKDTADNYFTSGWRASDREELREHFSGLAETMGEQITDDDFEALIRRLTDLEDNGLDITAEQIEKYVCENVPAGAYLGASTFNVDGQDVTLRQAIRAQIENTNENVDRPYIGELSDYDLALLGDEFLNIIDTGVSGRYDSRIINCDIVRDGWAVYDAEGNPDESFRTRQEAVDWLTSGVDQDGEPYDTGSHVDRYHGVIE